MLPMDPNMCHRIKCVVEPELTLFIYYLFEILKTLAMSHALTRKGAEVIKCLNATK